MGCAGEVRNASRNSLGMQRKTNFVGSEGQDGESVLRVRDQGACGESVSERVLGVGHSGISGSIRDRN